MWVGRESARREEKRPFRNNNIFKSCDILEQGRRKWCYLGYISKVDSTVFVHMLGRSVKEREKYDCKSLA